jgi:hypothetical protein
MGLISKSKENRVCYIGDESQSSALFLDNTYEAQICSGGNISNDFNRNNKYKLGDNSIIDVEVDCEKKIEHEYFFAKKFVFLVQF